jgi:hypothetical protein
MLKIINRIKEELIKSRFNNKAKKILETNPLSNFNDKSDLYILSMVRSKDINMLLIALKSFVRFVPIKGVLIVKDPDITDLDEQLLKHHLVNVTFIKADEMVDSNIPRGGTWERIFAIASNNNNGYIIQIDADTITNQKPEQVIEAVLSETAFTLGTNQGKAFKSLQESVEFAKSRKDSNKHIQLLCESLLTTLPEDFSMYVRGCSGFAGFPKGKLDKTKLVDLSQHYYSKLGNRWEEWGTEQFSSNVMVSNIEPNSVLNTAHYDVPHQNTLDQTFVHYIGPTRYASLKYLKNVEKVIDELKSKV